MGIYYDEEGKKHEGIYRFNKLHGQWKSYYKSGELDAVQSYKSGKLHGYSDFYLEGSVKFECNYSKGKLEGRKDWYYPSGKIMRTQEYRCGKKEGVDIVYYEDGEEKVRINYRNNKRVKSEEKGV